MSDDSARLWGAVSTNVRYLEEHAPKGSDVFVDVFVSGRKEPVRLGIVETTRDAWGWILMQNWAKGEIGEGRLDPDVRLVFAPAQYVERVEIGYEPTTGRPVGFSHYDLEAPPVT